MEKFNVQPVIDILEELIHSDEFATAQIDATIDALEEVKSRIEPEEEETVDKVDEIQDYLQYLLTDEGFSIEEAKEELVEMINSLKK